MRIALALLAALAACASPQQASRGAPPGEASSRLFQGTVAAGAEGRFETGRLTSPDHSIAGPFVLTYLSPGAELGIAATASGGTSLGTVAAPLAQPFHVAAGTALRLLGPGEVVYGGYRPMPITRALESYVGRQVLVSVGAAGAAEQWFLREIGGDHVTLERSRTYRVVAVRRISEITWTDLSGIDPTPRIVLAAE